MHVFMDSWIYGGEGKGFGLSDEMLPPLDPLTRRKEVLTGWDLRSSCSYENSILVPGEVMAENHGFMDLGSASTIKKAFSVDSTGGLLGNNSIDGRLATLTVSVPFNQKEAFREVEAGTKDSSSIIDTSAQDSSLIDLKLGRLGDYRDAKNSKLSKDIGTPPSHASHMPAKRIRSTSLNGQTPFCQVLGCNMNLSSSKDYHKRHKVCEVHSKTAKVIVNGIEQRFCQQCSRFHLLTEFDDGKRSCRKRLAGHNERRRKPQLGIHSGRNGKLFHSYHGSGYLGTPLLGRTSFVCPDIFPSGIFREVKYESNNWGKHQKLADDAMYSNPQPSLSVLNDQLVSKPFLSHYGLEKELPSMHCISTASGSISYDSSNHYGQGFNSSSSIFNDGSNIQGVSGVTESGCALSLLSSQSQNSSTYTSTYTSTIHVTQPLNFQGGHAQYSTAPFTDKPLLALGSQASTSVASNRFSSSGMNSVEDEQMGLSVSDASNALDFEVQTDGRYQGYRFMDTKDPLFNASGHTIDLLQLSSLLQSAEERRRSMQVKQECEAVSCLPMS